jgi:hypothetical protein
MTNQADVISEYRDELQPIIDNVAALVVPDPSEIAFVVRNMALHDTNVVAEINERVGTTRREFFSGVGEFLAVHRKKLVEPFARAVNFTKELVRAGIKRRETSE